MELAHLEKALATMLAIVAKNPDGRSLVPVVLRLEAEIRAHQVWPRHHF